MNSTEKYFLVTDGIIEMSCVADTYYEAANLFLDYLKNQNDNCIYEFYNYEYEYAGHMLQLCKIYEYNGNMLNTVHFILSQRKLNERQNRLLFGIGNTKLAAITGAQTWAMSEYPHVPKYSDMLVLYQKIYIDHNNKLVNIKLCTSGALPLYAVCSWATRTYPDSYIYTLDSIIDSNQHFRMRNSRTKIYKILAELFKDNKVFYATNDVGSFVKNYFSECSKKY